MITCKQIGFNQVSSLREIFIFPYVTMLQPCLVVAFWISALQLSKNENLSNDHPMVIHIQLWFNQVFSAWEKLFIHFHTVSYVKTYVLLWWPSWISEPHKKIEKSNAKIIHEQYGFNNVYFVRKSFYLFSQAKTFFYEGGHLGISISTQITHFVKIHPRIIRTNFNFKLLNSFWTTESLRQCEQ